METFKNTIRSLRCRMGWCQSDLAIRMGVPSDDVREWEAGVKTPTDSQAQLLERLFRHSETSMLEIQQTPAAEQAMDSGSLASVNRGELKA